MRTSPPPSPPPSDHPPIRVLVVDDSALVRQLLKTIIDAQADMTCIAVAKHADMALSMIRNLAPNVVTLDVEMPGMSGLQLLQTLMQSQPLPVVMISSQTRDGAQTTLTALELGAVDFVAKPSIGVADGLQLLAHEVVDKIRAASQAVLPSPNTPADLPPEAHDADATTPPAVAEKQWTPAWLMHPSATPPSPMQASLPQRPFSAHAAARSTPTEAAQSAHRAAPESAIKLIAIGASTGGTDAIRKILQTLPANAPPIAIVQHMPAGFTRSFAERLDATCALRVHEAEDGQRLEAGHAYIAPGGKHLRIVQTAGIAYAQLGEDAPVLRHRPSVDVLFRSLSRSIGAPHCLAVLLTGMGTDGAAAMLELKLAGAHTIAQDARSSVVYGMPREAAALGAVVEVLPLHTIAPAITRHVFGDWAPPSSS